MRYPIRRTLCAAFASAVMATALPATAGSSNNSSPKLRAAVTLAGVQRHQAAFQTFADAAGGHRFFGTAGFNASAQYLIDQLTGAGYAPTTHTFQHETFFDVTPARLQQTAPVAATYVNGNDFRTMQYSGSGDTTATVAAPSGASIGCNAADYAGFPAGSIALVKRGTCLFRVKTDLAAAAGATAILIYNNGPGKLYGSLGSYPNMSSIPSIGLTQALGEHLVATPALVMRAATNTAIETLEAKHVFAELPGQIADNVVVAGARLDSDDTGPGINSRASGSAALLEVAIHMAKVAPRNTVRFAWWSLGRFGSSRYLDALPATELDKIALYLNFDMIGSPNSVRFVGDGDNSTGLGIAGPPGSEDIEAMFANYFQSQSLASDGEPFTDEPFTDFGIHNVFAAKGIPSGGLSAGGPGLKTVAQAATYGGVAGLAYDPCFQAACDTEANTSTATVDQMSDAVAHSVITFAMSTEAVNGIKGKKTKKPHPNGNGGGGNNNNPFNVA